MSETIYCPNCNSIDFRCWDQREHLYKIDDESYPVGMPVSYLCCNDCDALWLHEDPASENLEDVTEYINSLD